MAVAHRLRCSMERRIFLPRSRKFLALQGGFLTTRPPRKPHMLLAFLFVCLLRLHASKLQNDYRTQLGTWPSSVLRYQQVCFTHCSFGTISTLLNLRIGNEDWHPQRICNHFGKLFDIIVYSLTFIYL